MKTSLTLLAGVILTCSSALADSWGLTPEVKDTPFVFGDTRIVLHYDTTRNQSFPEYKLGVYLKGKPVAEHEDVGFEQVFASADNTYFLGVSNSGLIKDAYVIFDRNGRILKRQPHDPRTVHYFHVSKTLIRVWYDRERPDVNFVARDGKLEDVRIAGCDGARISLLVQEDLSLRRFLLENLLESHAKPKEVCYVSFGEEPAGGRAATVRCDPPERFLRRFQDREYQVKPASAYPQPRDNVPFPENNPQTGIPDGIYTVEIVEWLDGDTARVKAEMYRDGLWARGEELIVERRERQWRIKARGDVWVS